jgi:hypothetical protein
MADEPQTVELPEVEAMGEDPLKDYWPHICTLLLERLGGKAEIRMAEITGMSTKGEKLRYELKIPKVITGDPRLDGVTAGVLHLDLVSFN